MFIKTETKIKILDKIREQADAIALLRYQNNELEEKIESIHTELVENYKQQERILKWIRSFGELPQLSDPKILPSGDV